MVMTHVLELVGTFVSVGKLFGEGTARAEEIVNGEQLGWHLVIIKDLIVEGARSWDKLEPIRV